ncbi:MAG: STAS domain-containing protein [Cytophagales bacterium]
MKFTTERTEQYTLIQIHAEKIDALRTPQLKTEITTLHAEGTNNFIIDFSDVKYIDSSGISAILLAKRVCENAGGILAIFGLNEGVRKVLGIAQLDKVLTILPTLAEAIDAIFLHAIEADLQKDSE